MATWIDPASFRDPSGFVFRGEDGLVHRQVNRRYASDFRLLMDSGLYEELTAAGLLVRHEEVSLEHGVTDDAIAVLRPEQIPFVSYPYEWCFGQLKRAALHTLEIQRRAMAKGLSLKDASAYNIQFEGARSIFIDTLSFEAYRDGSPWVAYRQFCQHFLAPLALMAKRDMGLSHLLQANVDGVAVDFASSLLGRGTWLNWGLLIHLHLHGRAVQKRSSEQIASRDVDARRDEIAQRKMSKSALEAFIGSLEGTVKSLRLSKVETTWSGYYQTHSYTGEGETAKKNLVKEYLDRCAPKMVWDLGANTGTYSRVAAEMGAYTMAFDVDWGCVERNYQACVDEKLENITPLWLDLANPSPAIGWANRERKSLGERGPADAVLALALIHHLCIGNNTPLGAVADYFSTLTRHLIIEFVPKEDGQTQRLLESREDIFDDYTREGFESAFGRRFNVLDSRPIADSQRVLYLMEAKD